jgi:hypothetical protein
MHLTPGHTVGTISLLIPVKDKGVAHTAAFWGGTSVVINSQVDNVVAYSASTRRFTGRQKVARRRLRCATRMRLTKFRQCSRTVI